MRLTSAFETPGPPGWRKARHGCTRSIKVELVPMSPTWADCWGLLLFSSARRQRRRLKKDGGHKPPVDGNDVTGGRNAADEDNAARPKNATK